MSSYIFQMNLASYRTTSAGPGPRVFVTFAEVLACLVKDSYEVQASDSL